MPTNNFQITQLVDKEYPVARFANSLTTAYLCSNYDGFENTASIGQSVQIEYPNIYTEAVPSLAYTVGDVEGTTDRVQTMQVGNVATIGTSWPGGEAAKPLGMTNKELRFQSGTITKDKFQSKYIDTAVQQVGNYVNQQAIRSLELFASDSIGDPTQVLSGFNTTTQIEAQICNMGLSACRRNSSSPPYFALAPNTYSQLQIPYAEVYFNEQVNYPLLKGPSMAMRQYGELMCYKDEDINAHTTGTFDAPGAVTVAANIPAANDINQLFTLVQLTGFTPSATGVLEVGDLIEFGTVANGDQVQMVNPQNFRSYGKAKRFVVRGNDTGGSQIDADGAGNVTIQIYINPVADPASSRRNIDRAIVAGMAVTLVGSGGAGVPGSYTKNWVFFRDAFLCANPDIGSFPMSGSGAKEYSGYPNEMIISSMEVPCSDLKLSVNIGASGFFREFENEWAARSIFGFMPFQGFAFSYLSSNTL